MKLAMNVCKKLLAFGLVLTLCCSFAVSAEKVSGTYELPQVKMNLTLPEGTYAFTSETADTDPSWKEAGLTEPVKYKTEYNDLGVLVHFSANNGESNIYVSKKETDTTKSYYSLASMTEEQLQKFLEPYNAQQEGSVKSSGAFYDHEQTLFVKADMRAEATETGGKAMSEQVYFTIVNGYTVSLSTHAEEGISEQTQAFLKSLVDSAHFTEILPRPELSQEDVMQAVLLLVVLALLIAGIVFAFVFAKVRARKRKEATRRLAAQIAVYREDKAQRDLANREAHFENTTDHSDAAIRVFSKFQTYVHKPLGAVLSILISVVGTIVCAYTGSEWWLTLLIGAAAVFCIFRFVTGASTVEKNLKKVYKNMRSRKAKYIFYDREFLISGLQSAEEYPYFQISDIQEYKDYLYIYFGENNCFFVNKNSFSKGDAAGLKAFLREKTGKKI